MLTPSVLSSSLLKGQRRRTLQLVCGNFMDCYDTSALGLSGAVVEEALNVADIVFLQVAIPQASWPRLLRLLCHLPVGSRLLSFLDLGESAKFQVANSLSHSPNFHARTARCLSPRSEMLLSFLALFFLSLNSPQLGPQL